MAVNVNGAVSGAASGAASGSAAGPYGAVIGAGIGAVSSLASDLFGSHSASKANATNIQLAREANAFQEKMWNKSNEWNSPVNMIEQYRKAGINPAFIYGSLQGNSSALGAVTPSVSPYQYSGVAHAGDQIAQGSLAFQQLKLQQKQVRNDTERVDIEHAQMMTQKALADSNIALNGKQMDNLTKQGQQLDEQIALLKQQGEQNDKRFEIELKQLNQNLINSMEQEIGIKIDNQTKDWMLSNLYPLQADLLNRQISYQDLVCQWYDKISDSQVFANRKSDLVQWLIGTFGKDIEEKIRQILDDSKGTTKSYQALTDEEKSEYALEFAREMQARRNRGEKPDAKKVSERIKARILARHKKK